ncbi:MAG: RNA polymerase sigma factor [Acidobacteriota bacterium]
MDLWTDHRLMLRVKEGQVAMLGVLFERHHLAMFNFFLRLTGRRDIAEDLVQELFLRMLKYRHNYESEGHYPAWMYQIARRVHLDYRRRTRPEQRQESTEESGAGDQLAGNHPLPEEVFLKREEVELIRTALAQLPAEKRELLILARYQQLKYQEIAEILDCEVGTVKARVFRALEELASAFENLANIRVPRARTRRKE